MPKTIKLTLSELFAPINGNPKYTKTYCKENEGEYIVYTGTTIGIFGKVNHADYTTPNLTFTTDGEKAGTIEYICDEGYCIGGHRTILIPRFSNLELRYFKYILQPFFYNNVKRGDVPSLHFNRIKNIEVDVPIDEDGQISYKMQKELADKYEKVENLKLNLLERINRLNNTNIVFDDIKGIEYKEVKITDLFKLKGGNMKLSKEWCNNHSGSYPVYSGSKSNEIFSRINGYDYDGEYLTWVIDGLAGYVKIINGKFSITCHRGILFPKAEYKNIDLQYLAYMIEPVFRKRIRGRMGVNGKNEYTALKPSHIKHFDDSIKIPIKNGEFDLEKQRELANKYAKIALIKEEISSKIIGLTDISV